MTSGKVWLVGAGPGDVGLMTVRGMALLGEADVVVFDSLASKDLLKNVRPGAELIDVGKRGGMHKAEQDEINEILFQQASSGRTVVRLKGGDPFLFGRGGEEVLYLRAKGIDVGVVPGVSSSLAVPELAGIPVTHRNVSSGVTIITGHQMEGGSLDWVSLARSGSTLVILMGMSNLEANMRRLIEGGLPSGTPVAVIQEGSTSRQKVLVTCLENANDDCSKDSISAPAIIVVGDVVSLRAMLGDLA